MKGLVVAGGLAALVPGAGWAQACPVLPSYDRLQAAIGREPAVAAMQALYDYAADPANEPVACEAILIDRQIAERERALVTLVTTDRRVLRADTAFHCEAPDPRTTRCDGIVADSTGQLGAVRIRDAAPIGRTVTARLVSRLPDARLIGLYRTTRADIGRARPVARLKAATPIRLGGRGGGTVLIALFTAPAPYTVRKLVWYF